MKWFYGLYPTDRIKINNKYYYISNFFPKINILFSVWPIISRCKSYYTKIKEASFREVFSIPHDTEVIADSGSFSYFRSKVKINFEWNLQKIVKIYDLIKPNYAVHNDIPISLIKRKDSLIINKSLNKNLVNAKNFKKVCKNKEYNLIGVAQGVSLEDYVNQILDLYYLGYNYIGLGGIAYSGVKKIDSILSLISKNNEIGKLKIKLHIFGVGRITLLKKYQIYSFDNTSPLIDSHRDGAGKRTYYYIFDEIEKVIKKNSLIDLQKKKYNVTCKCPVCVMLSNDILLTGSAFTNHSRAFHNAHIYQKAININSDQHKDNRY